ncbi:hypothetical protein HG536_0E04370 [Torulaspora globosa]|uniref:FCP1 homology domain-containing protein n=1 Tax=Torulaspora globosa TaxID=48254 RepID=A0A7G3ZJ40_9SACH|nr:uncharacterized protein HG536_0E04370 [Torulaspora globosa]QLL33526.1 hypothetical protein HG536_0E04370 [Torulaspora globosa]
MGFIASILCCSSDTSQHKSHWQSGQHAAGYSKGKSQTGVHNSQSNIHSTLSKSSQKMAYSSQNLSGNNGQGTANGTNRRNHNKRTGNDDRIKVSEKASDLNVGVEEEKEEANEKVKTSGSGGKKRYGNSSGDSNRRKERNERTPPLRKADYGDADDDEDKEYDDDEEEDEIGEGESVEDKARGTANTKSVEEVTNEKDKHAIYVYNGETDTSTGGSSYDQHLQQQSQTQTQLARGVGDIVVSDGGELTTTVHEGENCSSAEDTDIALQNSHTNDESADYDMAPPYEDEEEFVDLTELQLGQAHAQGYNTLLPPKTPEFKGKKCLVLDLDETLVHSSFKYLRTADFVLPVDIDDQIHNVYVIKRPGVDEFLKRVGSLYEVVVFTASVSRYGDPLLDILDKHKSVHHRLFRESCYNYEGNYIKNLSQIGRPLSEIIILDNSPASYIFHPQHAIPISSWFSDTHDNELLDIIPLLEDLSERSVPDVGKVLDVTI